MSEGPWIRFFPSDWLAGTRGMSAAETGIYITLIAMMYERGEPLRDDRTRLARLCGTTPAALKSTLETLIDEDKIQVIDGGYWNRKVGVETEFRREKSTSARDAADKRWKNKQQNQRRDDADAMPEQSGRNANHNHIPEDASQAQHPVDADGRVDLNLLEEQLRKAAGLERDPGAGLFVLAPIIGLIEAGHDLQLDILPTIKSVMARSRRKPRTWDYFVEAIREASARRRGAEQAGLAPAAAPEAKGGDIFQQFAQEARNGSGRDRGSDGVVIDAVPGIPGPERSGEPVDGESLHDGDRRMHDACAAHRRA